MSAAAEDKEALIRAYKTILKDAVDARPSGVRLRIAELIGKKKSFVSQITNPNYKTPVPEKYLEPIFEAAHLIPQERARFLELYRLAHPRASPAPVGQPRSEAVRVLRVELPVLGSPALEAKVDQLVRQFARSLSDVAGGDI